jgi:hypothetical protein
MCNLSDNYNVYLINDTNNTDVINCTETSEDNNNNLFEACNDTNKSFFICEIVSPKTGKYNLQINDDNNTIVYRNNNVINIYNIEYVEFFNQNCLDFSLLKVKNFVKVLFDRKIKKSDINIASLTENHSGYILDKNSFKQNTNGTYEVVFDLILNESKNEKLTESMTYIFTINLTNSDKYISNYNFSFEGKNITHIEINNTSIDDSENSNSTSNSTLKFYGVGSNKITLSGKKNSSYGTLKLIFNHNISNYSVSNFRAKSLPNISVETPSYFQNYRNDTRNPRYYHYFNVSGNYSGTSKLEFQMCGNYYETIPLKFIINEIDKSNHCLCVQLKIPFFIFLFLFFI